MDHVTIYHNPNCSSSRSAVQIAEELGVDAEIILYRAHPPDRDRLRWIIARLEDPPTALVRRDSLFTKLGLAEDDVATPDQVVEVLAAHGMLLQRPVVVRGERAIVGRPRARVRALLTGD